MRKILSLIIVIAIMTSNMAFAGGWFTGASDWVQTNGSEISVSVNGKNYISVTDKTYSDVGTFGIRTWKCDATYSNYTVNPLPY